MEIRRKADSVEAMLKADGVYRIPNDEPGFASSVASLLHRRFPNSDLKVQEPPRNFGGEYVFRSSSHLGTKVTEGE
ncbi:MAG: hypothetical protein B7Z14_07705 [Bosea sp. 32-68-6]|nr:MAG: hypothetical protein B7Z14_07705 [Bosea sp. 32-68-6]